MDSNKRYIIRYCWHAHRESETFFKLTGQLAQPNQDAVVSKRAAFFNRLTNKIGHIMAKASALRVNLNLAPTVQSPSRSRTSTSHAPLLCALNLSQHVLPPYSAKRASSTFLQWSPLLLVASYRIIGYGGLRPRS